MNVLRGLYATDTQALRGRGISAARRGERGSCARLWHSQRHRL